MIKTNKSNPAKNPEYFRKKLITKNSVKSTETNSETSTKPKKTKLDAAAKKQLRKSIRIVKKMNKKHSGSIFYKNSPDCVIELENVSKWYSNNFSVNKILENINLTIKRGEFVVILGPSGSGKTTLLNIISGMDRASNGQVIVSNHNLITMSNKQLTKFRKEYVSFVFQQYGLLGDLKIRENIELGAQLQDNYRKRLDIDEVISNLGILRHSLRFPREISGGQQQRVAIARALVKNPEILFGDEPTGAVDEETSKQILKMFCEINAIYKTTIVIVTHNPIIAELATKVIVVSSGTLKEVREQVPKSVDELNWVIE
ncbi:putative ABC transport system ATP-binding protein [Mycoplasmoides fastidiosum]|uniref:ABC transport system ATP-binding protein n=1 Tax=Mycoplasmoides fastidiosum TaxID=92758 RepID=A0ABU0LZ20_9BACT|nr:ABC transporter ATP-binding protein [Mycoplasmoides fastidiosum]MDQ0513949.1 putative ABC transport system ATP-binding protein [Mycoplasmoides fastidiosum]UUD37637.1 ABC transporter ATP-binding protein [Mycoplasmoides fastidiosum]